MQKAEQRTQQNGATSGQEVESLVPVPALATRAQVFWARNQEAEKAGLPDFIQGRTLFYDGDLEGLPFVFASFPIFRTQTGGQYGDQLVAQSWIQFVQGQELSDPFEARMTGKYIHSQLRGVTEGELVGSYIWTLRRNEEMVEHPVYGYPRMLARFRAGLDKPPAPAVREVMVPVSAFEDETVNIAGKNVRRSEAAMERAATMRQVKEIPTKNAVPGEPAVYVAPPSKWTVAKLTEQLTNVGLPFRAYMDAFGSPVGRDLQADFNQMMEWEGLELGTGDPVLETESEQEAVPVKRGRGRPRKNP